MTAYIALKKMARVEAGETILVQAAAGALGTATIMLAKAMGLKVAGTASTQKKILILEKLDVDLAINYSNENFCKIIMNWTENLGVNIILESVGGTIFKESLNCLSPMGRLILVGISSVKFSLLNPLTWWPTYRLIPRINLLSMLGKSQGILAFHVGRLLDNNYSEIAKIFLELVNFVQKHNIFPLIGKIYPLDEIADAHRFIESRKSFGKILLQIK
jgi:NADPH2:quinone reductase